MAALVTSSIPTWSQYLKCLFNGPMPTLEKNLDFFKRKWHLSIYVSVIYLVCLLIGKGMMKKREAFHLRTSLALWNAFLAAFSLLASCSLLPELFQAIRSNGLTATYCQNNHFANDDQRRFWYTLFTLSKVVELGDTLFIILRKTNLITLHWFHHTITLIYSFYSYQYNMATIRWMCSMNVVIHSLMYTYYCFKALGFHLSKSIAKFITITQIGQMVIGFGINGHVLWIMNNKQAQCQCALHAVLFGFLMYLMYLYCFVTFYLNSYNLPKKIVSKQN